MKFKLRDMTIEDMKVFDEKVCGNIHCSECIFSKVICNNDNCWVRHKELYSDEFLNQEIEIKDEPILTERERTYLSAVIKPFRDVITYIVKSEVESVLGNNYNFITIKMCGGDSIILPMFPTGKYYKNMEAYKDYTLKELEIYDND